MKKTIGIFLISSIALSIFLCNGYFFGSIIISKYEASHTEELEQISLSENQLELIHGHEISLNGQMYDIEKLEKINDQYIATVYNDKRETNLLSSFKKNKNKDSEIILLNYLSLVTDSPLENFTFNIYYKKINYSILKNMAIISSIISVLSPPPDFIS